MNQYTAQIIPAGPAAVRVLVLRNGATRLDQTLKGPVPSGVEKAKKLVSAELGSIPIKWKQVGWGHFIGSASGQEAGGLHGSSKKNPLFGKRRYSSERMDEALSSDSDVVQSYLFKDWGSSTGKSIQAAIYKADPSISESGMRMWELFARRVAIAAKDVPAIYRLARRYQNEGASKETALSKALTFTGQNRGYKKNPRRLKACKVGKRVNSPFITFPSRAMAQVFATAARSAGHGTVMVTKHKDKVGVLLGNMSHKEAEGLKARLLKMDQSKNPYMNKRQILTCVRKGELDKLSYSQLQIAALSLLAHSPIQKTVQAEMAKRPEYKKNPYMGFKKLTTSLAKKGVKDAKALAASIGRKKYGKKLFGEMAQAAKAAKAKVSKLSRVVKGKKKNPIPKGLTAALTAKKELWLFVNSGNDQTHVVIKPGEKVKVSYSPGIRYATAYKQHWSGKMTSASIEETDLRDSFKTIPDSWNVPKENPKGKKKNPNSEAAAMYQKFHGRPSSSVLEFKEREHVHSHLSQLGTLSELKVVLNPLEAASKQRLVTLAASGGAQAHEDSKAVHLCSSEDGTSLYLVGGDQKLDLKALGMSASADVKDLMVIGVIDEVTYRTQKDFDKFKTLDYFHGLGEVTGKQPMLLYKARDKKMLIAGGQYLVKREGITN